MTDWMQPNSAQANVTTSMSMGEAPATPTANPAGGDAGAGAVRDIGTREFGKEVIEASAERAVLVDFWAPWCGPCKQLGPVIERAVAATNGAVRLVKMDIDQHPEIAGQMGIQSIPAVVAFIDGRPADAFMGAKPEAEVKAFIDKVLAAKPVESEGADIEAAIDEAAALAQAGDHAGAADIYAAILGQEPGNLDALAGLGQCYVAVGETERAQSLIDSLPQEHRDAAPIAALQTALNLAAKANDLGEIGELAGKVEQAPNDHQARYDYALALNAHGRREEAAEQLIEIVRTDRTWNEDGARVQLVEFFDLWGNADPATLSGRRALSSILFS